MDTCFHMQFGSLLVRISLALQFNLTSFRSKNKCQGARSTHVPNRKQKS